MTAPRKQSSGKPREKNPQQTIGQANLWTAKGVSINLSQPRRESLKAFADASGKAATPAQALYALIDLLEPAAVSGQLADIGAGRGEVDAPEVTQETNSNIVAQRLSEIETDTRDMKKALASCASALEDISNAMVPIRDLIAALSNATASSPSAASPRGAPHLGRAMELKEWFPAVANITARAPSEGVAFNLHLAERPRATGNVVQMTFDTRAAYVDSGSAEVSPVSLPMLAISADAGGALAVCLSVEPRAELAMVFTRAKAGAWRASVRLRTNSGAYGRVLFEATP
jgi:hypothetical protein